MSTLFAQLTAAAKPRPPMVKSVTREAVEKRKVTVRAKLKANWSAVFAKLRNRAGTTEIAAQIGRSSMSVHWSLSKMVEYGWVKRDGSIPHPMNGRDQTIWKWVAE